MIDRFKKQVLLIHIQDGCEENIKKMQSLGVSCILLSAQRIVNLNHSIPECMIGAYVNSCEEFVEVKDKVNFIVSSTLSKELAELCSTNSIISFAACSSEDEINIAKSNCWKNIYLTAEFESCMKAVLHFPEMNFIVPTFSLQEQSKLLINKNVLVNSSCYKDENCMDTIKKDIKAVLGFEIAHVGMNCKNENEAHTVSGLLCELFCADKKEGKGAIFVDSMVEVMKKPFLGSNGHVAVRTNSIRKACSYMITKGYNFNESSRFFDAEGNIRAIYLEKEYGGFAFHLVQKS